MLIFRKFSLWQTFLWTLKSFALFIIWDVLILYSYSFFELQWMKISWKLIALLGVALAFYLGLKNNVSYQRLWEARILWGRIVNTSRSFACLIINMPFWDKAPPSTTARLLILRHIAWLTALRYALRQLTSWEHQAKEDQKTRLIFYVPELQEDYENHLEKNLSSDDLKQILPNKNHPLHILNLQLKSLKDLYKNQAIDSICYTQLNQMVVDLISFQGGCERIKNFPLPRQYASTSMHFVKLFMLILPFGFIDSFVPYTESPWIAISLCILISWIFFVMERIGDYSENPFEGLPNDVPISDISQNIEINLRQLLSPDEELPKPYPQHRGIKF